MMCVPPAVDFTYSYNDSHVSSLNKRYHSEDVCTSGCGLHL